MKGASPVTYVSSLGVQQRGGAFLATIHEIHEIFTTLCTSPYRGDTDGEQGLAHPCGAPRKPEGVRWYIALPFAAAATTNKPDDRAVKFENPNPALHLLLPLPTKLTPKSPGTRCGRPPNLSPSQVCYALHRAPEMPPITADRSRLRPVYLLV